MSRVTYSYMSIEDGVAVNVSVFFEAIHFAMSALKISRYVAL